MRVARVVAVFAFSFLLHAASAFAAVLPKNAFPIGYENWESRTFSCRIKNGVTSELRTYTHRGSEGIIRAISIWYANGSPFEAKYFEPVPDEKSLSGFRATGFAVVLDRSGEWVTLGGRGRLMNNIELLELRLLRVAYLERYRVGEEEFKKAWAVCNRDRPSELR